MPPEVQSGVLPSEAVIGWLLEPSNPCVRWRALRELLGKTDEDPEVHEAAAAVYRWPPIARVFEMAADPARFAWPAGIRPVAAQPCRDLAALARVGVPPGRAELRLAAAALKQRLPDRRDSDCYLPQMVAALVRFGDPDDPDVPSLVEKVAVNEVLADGDRPPTGGGGCCDSHSCHSAVARALDCVASVPGPARTPVMRAFLARGAAYLSAHRLYQRNRHRFTPIRSEYTKLHQPWALDWLTDILDLLDIATRMGMTDSPGLAPALRLLLDKQLPDGRWPLEVAYHTDRPLIANLLGGLEEVGEPGKWVTLTALLLLRRSAGLVQQIREGADFPAPPPPPITSFVSCPSGGDPADRARLRAAWDGLPGMLAVLEGLEIFARGSGLEVGWHRGLAMGPAECREWCVSQAKLVPARTMKAAFPVARTLFLAPRGLFTVDNLAKRLQVEKYHSYPRPVRPGSWVEKALWRLRVEKWNARWDTVGIAIGEAAELPAVTRVMAEALTATADSASSRGWSPE